MTQEDMSPEEYQRLLNESRDELDKEKVAEEAAKADEIEEPVAKPTEAKAPEKPTETKTETPKETKPETTSSAPDPRDSNKGKGLLGGIGVSETGNITGFGGQELSYFGTPLFTSGGNNHPSGQMGLYSHSLPETLGAPGLGVMDFGVDLVNRVTGTNIPKIAPLENDVMQGVRELSSVVLPTMMLGGVTTAGGTALHARLGWGLGNNPLFKWFSKAGIGVGSGLAVDDIASINETDDDPLTMLVKTWPKTWGFIPRDWTSLDCDSPRCKQIRNRDQGAFLGAGLSVFEGFIKYAAKRKGLKEATGWISETERADQWLKEQAKNGAENVVDAPPPTLQEQAATWYNQKEQQKMMAREINPDQARTFDELSKEEQDKWVKLLEDNGAIAKPSDDPLTAAQDYIVRQEAKAKVDLEEEGVIKQRANPDSDDPIEGVHDMFEHRELGSRTADNMGIVGAAKDQAQVMREGVGRLGSVYSSAALKFSLMVDNPASRSLFKKAKETLKAAREVAYKAGDHLYTSKEISEQGDELAAKWLDPNMSAKDLKKALDDYKTNLYDGVKYLSDGGYDAALKALRGYFDEYLDMDELKAAAYINTSMAGQVSDLAEAARLTEGTAAVRRVQSEIFDRIQILMAEKGVASYIAGRSLNMKKRWKRLKTSEQILAGVQNGEIEMGELIKQKYGDAQRTVDILRDIHRERPEMLGPMMLAYEMSNGKIDTVAKLNEIVANNLGGLSKAFFDKNPHIPSQLINALYSNYYNNILTSIGTPAKAGFGNLVNMVTKPLSLAIGGILDKETLQRGWMQYSGFSESLRRGFEHMSKVFVMASKDPTSVGYIMREDIVRVNKDNMTLLNAYADAQAEMGNDGPAAIVQFVNELDDVANNPLLRFGANAMTAFDGFTRAMVASSEARIRAFDKLKKAGKEITPENLKMLTEGEYSRMFDPKTGMIVDDQVDYTAREMALSLDNKGVDDLNKIIQRAPILKPFILFPRTQMNAIALFDSASPLSVFARDFNDIAYKPIEKMGKDEILEHLTKRGIPTDGDILKKFATLRAEIRGRKAIGMMTMMGATALFMNDSLRGNGYHKKEVQKTRREADWQPRTYKGWDGNWYSYDGMGFISDFLALTADIGDNLFTGLDTARGEQLFGKMAFILGANLTNKSYMASLEPMMDVLQQNPAALNRFAATAGSGALPLSGARRELSQLMYPGLREVDDELGQLLRNRNGFLDFIDPERALPFRKNWITGEKVGEPKDFWTRIVNTFSPIKKYDGLDEREQFLIDIEFEHRPIMNKADNGHKFTNAEQEELYTLIAEDKQWQAAIKRAMADAKDFGFTEQLSKFRNQNIPSEPGASLFRSDNKFVDKKKFQMLHFHLKAALEAAKDRAIESLSNYDEIRLNMDNFNRMEEDSKRNNLTYF